MWGERAWTMTVGALLAVVLVGAQGADVEAQTSATHPRPMSIQGSSNLHVLAHLPLGGCVSCGGA